jgi:hypothetical protein
MPKIIASNQTGIIVLFLYPTPNSLKLPSLLYKKAGLMYCIREKITKNTRIATNVILF